MAHDTESGREKMAEGDNNAEKLKEKANTYFKGTFFFILFVLCVYPNAGS